MKIRDLRPCDNCGKPIGQIFYILRGTMAVVKTQSIREYVGLSLMLGSGTLAEAMGAHQDQVVALLADQKDDAGNAGGWSELLLCGDCHCAPIIVAVLAEKRAEKEAAAEASR